MNTTLYTNLIKNEANRLGFDWVGISKAERLDDAAEKMEVWLKNGNHGKMQYLENHFEKRMDPRKLVDGAKSIISLSYNYFTHEKQSDTDAPKISSYAYGKDYHDVIKEKLKMLIDFIQNEIGEVSGRGFVDSAPVMEREWAKRSGLGWLGKNTLLIHPKKGSFFFLAELIIDLELDYDQSMKDFCGTCSRCIDACPTEAIHENGYLLDASKCISYLTIELKDELPQDYKNKMGNWMFGCDICQDVCPWNRFSKPHQEPNFLPHPDLLSMTNREWHEITDDVFKKLFIGSAVQRTKFKGLKRNLNFLNPDNE